MKVWQIFAAAAVVWSSHGAAQRADPIPVVEGPIVGPITTNHQINVQGRPVPYRAIFREYALNSPDGHPEATISATAYVRSDVSRGTRRPLFFFFNGGPGASSSPLHFTAFGPRLRPTGRDAAARFTDNPDSLIDVADLVFVDPVGTGFSRVLPGGDGSRYWAPQGDADAVLQLVRTWIEENGRQGDPVFIGGESYGAFRLATMTRNAENLNLEGLLLVSPATSMAGLAGAAHTDSQYVFSLPTMAVSAWHHQKVARRGRTAEQFYKDALRFAETDYLVALHKGSELSRAERERIATHMSEFIGLPLNVILDANLRVSNDLFVETLLSDQNLLVGRLDTRVTGPVKPPARSDRPAAANDPALGLGATNVIRSPAITRYMREELRVPVDRDYVSLTLDVNFRWNWFETVDDRRSYYNPLTYVAAMMGKRRSMELMTAGGLYDLATPVASARYAIRHTDIPLDRVRSLTLPAGHSPFEEPENRARFATEVREFVNDIQR